ncbi:MAG: ATP-binding cassette domain-containing protein [Ignavibacteriaceae bacterium]
MLYNLSGILQIGFLDGLRWFPFVLTIGLLYKYLNIIDISIDGVSIISSIFFSFIWNSYHSFLFAFVGTSFITIILYWIVSFLIYELKINNILAGIIFTLILYSLSVIFIGESYQLDYSKLTFLNSPFNLILIVSFLAISIELFFRSNLGTKIRVVSDNQNVNLFSNARLLIFGIYSIAGFVLSFGVILYTSNLGLSRAGGGFEFLITSLSSYLFIDRIIEIFLNLFSRHGEKYSYKRYLIFSLFKSPVFKAIIGSIFFQIIVLTIIYYTANPAYWKLFFGLVLLLTIAKPQMKFSFFSDSNVNIEDKGLYLKNLYFSYDNGYEQRKVFSNLTCHFMHSINLIWGDNGAGKTSLLRLIIGEITPINGKIYSDGIEISNLKRHKRNIFYIAQNPFSSLSPNTTVYENIIATIRNKYLNLFSLSSPLKSIQYIDKTLIKDYNSGGNISDSFWVQNVSKLSGGQAQKLNLLISSVSSANIILADEPTSGMDNINFDLFINFIKYLENKGKLVIIVTHDIRFTNFVAEHFKIIDGDISKITGIFKNEVTL